MKGALLNLSNGGSKTLKSAENEWNQFK